MIRIELATDGINVFDSFKYVNTTLLENAIILSRIEEIKQVLLNMEYKSDIELKKEEEDLEDE
jgi:hypothetical protein